MYQFYINALQGAFDTHRTGLFVPIIEAALYCKDITEKQYGHLLSMACDYYAKRMEV